MQKGPLPNEMRALHRERVRAGQERARAAGRTIGRPGRYPDALIREAMRRHDNGQTWAAAAEAIGVSVSLLYARVRGLRNDVCDGDEPPQRVGAAGPPVAGLGD